MELHRRIQASIAKPVVYVLAGFGLATLLSFAGKLGLAVLLWDPVSWVRQGEGSAGTRAAGMSPEISIWQQDLPMVRFGSPGQGRDGRALRQSRVVDSGSHLPPVYINPDEVVPIGYASDGDRSRRRGLAEGDASALVTTAPSPGVGLSSQGRKGPLDLEVAAVHLGDLPYLLLHSGERVYQGTRLGNGIAIESIQSGALLLSTPDGFLKLPSNYPVDAALDIPAGGAQFEDFPDLSTGEANPQGLPLTGDEILP